MKQTPKCRQFTLCPRLSEQAQTQVIETMISKAVQEGTCALTTTDKDGVALDENMMLVARLLGCPAAPSPLKKWGDIWKFHMNWFITKLPPGVSLNRSPTAYRLNAVAYWPLPADAFYQ